MLIIGLTGSIGMGKSTTAKMFKEAGIPVYDADAAVADLYETGGAAVVPLEAAFPGVTKDGAVDREALRQRVLGNDEAMAKLNSIVHPLVGADRIHFFKAAEAAQADMVVLDIPLLYETGGHANMDAVVVVSAPESQQRERVLAQDLVGVRLVRGAELAERADRQVAAEDALVELHRLTGVAVEADVRIEPGRHADPP